MSFFLGQETKKSVCCQGLGTPAKAPLMGGWPRGKGRGLSMNEEGDKPKRVRGGPLRNPMWVEDSA